MGIWVQVSWEAVSENLLCGCHQAVCWDCNLICSLSWGRVCFQIHLWLLVCILFKWTIGLRATVFHGLCLNSLSPVSHSRGASFMMACFLHSEWASETVYLRKKTQTFCNSILEVTPHHLCSIPFIRNGSISPAHSQEEGIIWRSEYQESIHFRGCLPSTSGGR